MGSVAVAVRRAVLLARLNAFCLDWTWALLSRWLAEASADGIDDFLAQYGQAVYNAGRSLHDYEESI